MRKCHLWSWSWQKILLFVCFGLNYMNYCLILFFGVSESSINCYCLILLVFLFVYLYLFGLNRSLKILFDLFWLPKSPLLSMPGGGWVGGWCIEIIASALLLLFLIWDFESRIKKFEQRGAGAELDNISFVQNYSWWSCIMYNSQPKVNKSRGIIRKMKSFGYYMLQNR